MNTCTQSHYQQTCRNFALKTAPLLCIKDDTHYQESLELIEILLEEAEDSLDDPLNSIISMLTNAVEVYENKNTELLTFASNAMEQAADLSILRLLMDQYHLGMADLPEIGSKSMVSRVLSGQRKLNRQHIEALSKRFQIDPGLFF